MHQIPAYINAGYASFMALHFWPIFDPSPAKTAEIRHFPPRPTPKLFKFSLTVTNRPGQLTLPAHVRDRRRPTQSCGTRSLRPLGAIVSYKTVLSVARSVAGSRAQVFKLVSS
jgi:hypothetical protein